MPDISDLTYATATVQIRWAEGNEEALIVAVDNLFGRDGTFTIRSLHGGTPWIFSIREAQAAYMSGDGVIAPLPSVLTDGSTARVGPRLYTKSLPYKLCGF